MKTSELTSDKLDYWVAKAQGWTVEQCVRGKWVEAWWYCKDKGIQVRYPTYKPTTNWQQCGELIEKLTIDLFTLADRYMCNVYVRSEGELNIVEQYGSTPQEAICRAVVASVYGEEVNND